MKVMDKGSLVSRNKLPRAQTEREILGLLDHPFLPTLYSHFETDKFFCLLMEFCSGGNLHSLRQKQPNKHFTEHAARFYASEVLLALEYLHMLGVVYRDLKPENVLVREEGHIMLSDFDLSLRCAVSPTLVRTPDLIRGLLAKEPQKRLAYRRGAAEIKQHPFFEGVNWALVRSAAPPYIPDAVDCGPAPVRLPSEAPSQGGTPRNAAGGKAGSPHADPASYVDFEYF
ncbi:Protein kinase G11A [Triticum urartu]|uniref:non-specific serine/threonine protein kinase n=2 Tax=Triticum TaxID=4564 RepID=A0A9R0WTP0_TRITD|nr:Protein kinase G11A [Triticum urartu]VAI23574.1 unnamed protein product [Triticum turgidum subsp. durum]